MSSCICPSFPVYNSSIFEPAALSPPYEEEQTDLAAFTDFCALMSLCSDLEECLSSIASPTHLASCDFQCKR